jgi:hypothetical protein
MFRARERSRKRNHFSVGQDDDAFRDHGPDDCQGGTALGLVIDDEQDAGLVVRTADQPLQMNVTMGSVSSDTGQYRHPCNPLHLEDANQRLVERLALPLVPLVENRENELNVSRECSSRATERSRPQT